jgi:protein-S-isoprenylcysteine O-methyltransferase Ste14
MMLSAVAVWIGSLPFVAATIGFFAVINSVFCPYEEAKLSKAFAADYRAYKEKVRRWI